MAPGDASAPRCNAAIVSAMSPLLGAALVVLLEGLATAAVFPVMHAYCAALGGGELWVGVLFALVAGPKVLLNPLWGRLSDRLGRRPMLIAATLGTLSGSIGWAVARNLTWLAVARLVVGVFSAQAALAQAAAVDVTPPYRRAHALALLGTAFGISFTLGPLMGGLLGSWVSPASVGWACAASQLVSLLVVLFALPETRAESAVAGAAPAAVPAPVRFRDLVRAPAVALLLLATLAMTLSLSELTSTLGLFTEHAYGFDTARTSYVFALLGLVAVAVQAGAVRRLSARFGDWLVAGAGMLALVGGYALFAAQPALSAFLAATVVLGVGAALSVPCVTAMLSRSVSDADQGAILGVNQSVIGAGRTVGYVLGTWLYEMRGAGLAFGGAAGLAAAALALLLPLRPSARSPRAGGAQAEVG